MLIQREFDKAFKELFGGGKGTLELIDEEDMLETGIRIISQPPGKKLQNMMQLSGGEKALTAICSSVCHSELKAVSLLSSGRDRGGTGRLQRGTFCKIPSQADQRYAVYCYHAQKRYHECS